MGPSILKKRNLDTMPTGGSTKKSSASKKRKLLDGRPQRKKPRKQARYTSPSSTNEASDDDDHQDDEFTAVDLASSASASPVPRSASPTPSSASLASSAHSSASLSAHSRTTDRPARTRKRNDPAAFSTSMAKILSSKLSTSKRADPVLARSATAAQASTELAESKLEAKARQKLREDKKLALDNGRVTDVLLGDAGGQDGGEVDGQAALIREQEKRLRKTAQRGVIKLFNAVRAAQIKGEEAARQGGAAGRKKERVTEMSKKGFLELVAGGGEKKGKEANFANIEEA